MYQNFLNVKAPGLFIEKESILLRLFLTLGFEKGRIQLLLLHTIVLKSPCFKFTHIRKQLLLTNKLFHSCHFLYLVTSTPDNRTYF